MRRLVFVGEWAWVRGLFLLCALLPGLAEVGRSQDKSLNYAASYIKSAEGDIRAAQGSCGTADRPATGSRLKLTKMRLSSAKQRLAQAAQYLQKVAAGDKKAAPMRQRYDACIAAVVKIEAIITPKAASTGKPATGSTPAKGTDTKQPPPVAAPRLDYKQEKLLKDARWYLRETTKYTKPALDVVAKMDGNGPKPVVRQVREGIASLDSAITKYNLAVKYIDQLPAKHPDVAVVLKGIQDARVTLEATRSRLNAESKRLQKLTGMENYPRYAQDLELLNDLSRRYNSFAQVQHQPEQLAQVISEDSQALKEFQRIAKTYQPLADQKTPEGQRLEKRVIYVMNKRKTFAAQLMEYRKQLPKAFEADLAQVEKIAKEAVEKQKPLWFGKNSGIEQNFGYAEKKLLVMLAFGPEVAKPYEAKLAATRQTIAKSAKMLEAQIIAANTLPSDRYTGKDRKELEKLAADAWAKKQPGAQVLLARIPAQAWNRDTRWRWFNGGFYKVDSSKLQVQLLIKHDDKLAVMRPINLYKNHLKGDTISASPMDTIKDDLLPQRYIPLGKIK